MLREASYSRFHIAVGGQDKLADNTVAPLGSGRIDGDGIVALLSNIKLEGLLSRTAEVVGPLSMDEFQYVLCRLQE